MYRLATKRTAKTSRRKREREFFFRHRQRHVYWFTTHYLLLRREVESSSWTSVVTLELIYFSGEFVNERLVRNPILPFQPIVGLSF